LLPIVGGDLQPGDVLGPGRRDPARLLSAWCVRKISYPLIWIGVIGAVLTRRVEQATETPLLSTDALLSPLAGLALGVLARLVAGGIGFLLAYRLTGSSDVDRTFGSRDANAMHRTIDRFHVARAYRELRWTEPVRAEAAEHLGSTGRRFVLADRTLTVVSWSLFVTAVVLAVVVSI
jgi:hypothetical protein